MDKFKKLPKEGFTNDEIEKKKKQIKKLLNEIDKIISDNFVGKNFIYQRALKVKDIDYFIHTTSIEGFISTPIIINISFEASFRSGYKGSIRKTSNAEIDGKPEITKIKCKELPDIESLNDLIMISGDHAFDKFDQIIDKYIDEIPDDDISYDDYMENGHTDVNTTIKYKCHMISRKD
jgi:hypothetical protein